MALTNAEILEQYKLARDAVLGAIADGAPVVRYRIGNREVQKDATHSLLESLEEMIDKYEGKDNVATHGRAKTLARFRRKP